MHWEAVKDEKKKEKSKGSRETFKEGKKTTGGEVKVQKLTG